MTKQIELNKRIYKGLLGSGSIRFFHPDLQDEHHLYLKFEEHPLSAYKPAAELVPKLEEMMKHNSESRMFFAFWKA